MIRRAYFIGASSLLLVAGLTLLRTPGARAQAAGLPPELSRLPADPQPGKPFRTDSAQAAWAVLETLDGKARYGIARGEADKKTYRFRFLPYASLWRFGAPGAAAEDYRPGERVLLTLVGERGQAPDPNGCYLLQVRDEISQQVQSGQCYRMVSQDRANYSFTAERIDAEKGDPEPDRLTLEYGRDTNLVLNEDPVYVFKVPPGTKLWVNSGYRGSNPRMAREVLDEVTLDRFRKQQQLRMIARANGAGGPAYVTETSGTGGKLLVFPDHAAWAQQLEPMESVRIAPAASSDPAEGAIVRVKRTSTGVEGTTLELAGAVANLKSGDAVRVTPVSRTVSYKRDVEPFLQVNCLSCHKEGRALGGYSLATREKMLAGGNRGPAMVPGKSAESLFYLTMTGDRNPRMPPDREPTREQLALVQAWIDAGAKTE